MNKVYIGTSLDGFIADKNGALDFLDTIKIPEGVDMGYHAFMDSIDALLMGKNTFETVAGFDVEWPYQKPVYVLSNSLEAIPEKFQNKAFLVKGALKEVINELNQKGHESIYIDGGKLIQSCLEEDLIDEMIITTIPVLIGGGIKLFGELSEHLEFELVSSQVFADHIVQNHYKRKS